MPSHRKFSKPIVAALMKDKILGVRAGEGDHRFIGVWMVVVNDRLFIRSWGVKKKSNDELRQRFVNLTVPQAQAVDLTLPDPTLTFDESSGNWTYGQIDWGEFWAVVKGNGPCNRERLAARNQAHDDGAWVRAPAEAYAAKRRSNGAVA